MTDERRAAQRLGGLSQVRNLLSTAETLRRREAWKYARLERVLQRGNRRYAFEFRIGRFIYDLALLDTKTLVEFDGPEHSAPRQVAIDEKKDRLARKRGFIIERRVVDRNALLSPRLIAGL